MSIPKTGRCNKLQISLFSIGILSFIVRAYLNFSNALLIGNGGYYPLQVRTLLERGEFAFSDMPLLFYLDAGIIRFLSLFGIPVSNELILNVVMIVDSLSIPLLLIPLYYILKHTKTRFSFFSSSIASFTVISFYTLILVSSSQKNALAITFLFCAIASFLYYLNLRQRKHLALSIAFFVLISLTHFGTFSFSILFIAVLLIFNYKWKAIIPLLTLIPVGTALIYLFDPVRSERLLSVLEVLFSKGPRAMELLVAALYIGLAILAIVQFRKFKNEFEQGEKAIIKAMITLLILIPLPIFDPQYTSRMNGFLFIPIVVLLLFYGSQFSSRTKKILSLILGFISLASVCFFLIAKPQADVSKEALADLENMQEVISNPNNTVIVSKHNLEFWVAWTLKVNVSQEAKFDDKLINEYDEVLILNQVKGGKPQRDNQQRNHFSEPIIPPNATLIYTSRYFKLYKYNRTGTPTNEE
ncbi:MAG: preprotein translocase subunit YajC [Crocinitomicaceae bacterium]|jgi:preprotein translocase subunit YajC